jgi:hypothetical protein
MLGSAIEGLLSKRESFLNPAEAVARKAGAEVIPCSSKPLGSHAAPTFYSRPNSGRQTLSCAARTGVVAFGDCSSAAMHEYSVRHTTVPVLLVRSQEPIGQ